MSVKFRTPITKAKDTKGVIKSRNSKKDRQYNAQTGQTIIYQIIHRKLKIEQHKSH